MYLRLFLFILVMMNLCVFECQAAWFWPSKQSEPENPKKLEWRKLTPEEDVRFSLLVNRRNEIRSELNMVERMLEEMTIKQREIALDLNLTYSVELEKSYRYDRDKSALYVLSKKSQPSAQSASEGETVFEESLHKKLTPAQEKDFVRLAETRRQTQEAVQGLKVLQQYKLNQWKHLCDQLETIFGIKRNHNYNYDQKKRVIYYCFD